MKIRLCKILHRHDKHDVVIYVYPGEQFNIMLKATNKAGSPVPAHILIDNSYSNGKYGISPLSQNINASCTNVNFRIYSYEEDSNVHLGIFPENPYQSLIKSLEITVYIQPCPNGFEISYDYGKRVCNEKQASGIYSKLLHR